jgi:hypothetical protein
MKRNLAQGRLTWQSVDCVPKVGELQSAGFVGMTLGKTDSGVLPAAEREEEGWKREWCDRSHWSQFF